MYEAGLGTDTVRGTGNTGTGYSYGLSSLSAASAAALGSMAMDGADGGWPLLYGATPLTATSINVVIDEDTLNDSERNHTTEQVGYIVFE